MNLDDSQSDFHVIEETTEQLPAVSSANAGGAEEKSGGIAKVTATSAQKPKSADKTDPSDKRKKTKKKYNIWWVKVAVISFVLAAFFSFLSELTASADHIVVILLLLSFLILASILFDAIGVAVTSCDVTPIISMASRKVYGAKTAMWLVKNSSTVASICNDVIGDIFGIISGACSAAIVIKITVMLPNGWQRWLSIIISAIVSALTIGGKAFMKNIAINNSKDFVMFVARLLAVFNKDERKIRKKSKKSDGKKDSAKDAGKGRAAASQAASDLKAGEAHVAESASDASETHNTGAVAGADKRK